LTTAVELGVPTYSVRYTRSPEARYPVARDQCLSVYKELITRGPPNGNGPIPPAEIYAQGSSSGGQILLSMMVKAHQDGTPFTNGRNVPLHPSSRPH
jgi:acetyl esterase/lipase